MTLLPSVPRRALTLSGVPITPDGVSTTTNVDTPLPPSTRRAGLFAHLAEPPSRAVAGSVDGSAGGASETDTRPTAAIPPSTTGTGIGTAGTGAARRATAFTADLVTLNACNVGCAVAAFLAVLAVGPVGAGSTAIAASPT